jgi:hypothetical protein
MSDRKKGFTSKKAQQSTKTSTKEANTVIKMPKKDDTSDKYSFLSGLESAILYGAVMICAVGLIVYFVLIQ